MLPMPGNWRWSVSGFNMSPVNIRHAVLHYPKWWEALGRATCVSSTGIRTGTELPTLSKIGSRHVDVEQDIGSKGESGAVTVCHLLRRRGIMGISPSNNQIQTTDCQRSLGSIVSMIPWLKRGSLQGLELPRVVSEKCSRFLDMFSEGTPPAVQCSLFLIKGCLHKVRGQRAFALDVSRPPALTFVSSSHQNFGCVFCNLYHTNATHYITRSKQKEKWPRFPTITINVKPNLGLCHFYSKIETSNIQWCKTGSYNSLRKFHLKHREIGNGCYNYLKAITAKYHESKKDDDQINDRPGVLRGSKPIILCGRAHKNISYAIHILQVTELSEKQTENQADNVVKALKLLEAANENLKKLLRHLQISHRNNYNTDKRGKRKNGIGEGPRSLSLSGSKRTDNKNHLYHTETPEKSTANLRDIEMNERDYYEKFLQEIPYRNATEGNSVSIRTLLTKVHNLGQFLQKIQVVETENREGKHIVLEDTEILILLTQAHHKLYHIINHMKHTISCASGGFDIDPEHERFREGQRRKKLQQDRKEEEMLKKREIKKILQSHRKAKREGKKLRRWKPNVTDENKAEDNEHKVKEEKKVEDESTPGKEVKYVGNPAEK